MMFSRVLADEDIDLGRKLDKRNELLGELTRNTSTLPAVKETLGSFVSEQRKHNKRMDDHNMRLERILEKLAER